MSPSFVRVHRGTIALLTSVAVLAAVLVLGSSQVAQADPVIVQPGELVVNGGGEQPVTVGWSGVLGRATHGSGGYAAAVIVDPNGLTGETYPGGSSLLTGLSSASVATQTIDLTPSFAAIDNGNVDALLSVYLGGYAGQRDQARVAYEFYDMGGALLDVVEFGPVTEVDRGRTSGFIHFDESLRLPPGTRQAVIRISTQRFTAPDNDGYIDNVSLILDAPAPTAVADTASTVEGVPVIVNSPANDAPGVGAVLVPGSLRLLDGDLEVAALTTADGTYVVDTDTGEVEFTPTAGFSGTTVPVPYRITDSSGQRADSTITIDVAVAAPALSLVKSAAPSAPADYVLGTDITYSFLVTNTGNVRTGGVAISEGLFTGSGPAPIASCPASFLEPKAQMTCTASYTLVQADIDSEGVSNTATAVGEPDGFDTIVKSDPSTVRIPVEASPAISLVKSADAVGADIGTEVEYSFLVTNIGNVTVDTISITERSFTGSGVVPTVECAEVALLPGASITCTAGYELTQADVDAGILTNTAIAIAAHDGESIMSELSSASVMIASRPSFDFTKTASRSVLTAAGQSIDYVFRISNTGNITLSNVVINETDFNGAGELSAISCPASAVAPGADLDCTASYTVVVADFAESALSNSAIADVDAGDVTLRSDVATAIVPIEVPEPVVPDPVVPDPVVPDPVVPDPVVPEPVVPEPAVPDPVVPDPAVPDPVVPDPEVPDPVVPDPEVPAPDGGEAQILEASGLDRLPATGGEMRWVLGGSAVFSLILGGVLLVRTNRRSARRVVANQPNSGAAL